ASTEAGSFGFHGTPTIESIGQAASNGCVRMYNEDVVALFSQVSVGTPVLIEP
ncbi:MAG: L,D-transpeptidase, partial [Cyanobacteria bacterium J06650_10]